MKPQSLQLAFEAARPAAPAPARSADSLEPLTAALEHEAVAVRQLAEVVVRQRAAVAANDVDAVQATVDDVGRVLLAVEAARRHREAVAARVLDGPRAPLERFVPAPGQAGGEAFLVARAALRRAAEDVAREAAINRTVLRRALDAGEAFLQALFSASGDPEPAYAPTARPARPASAGFLLNRKA